jgi:hypothetical protein
MGMALKSVTGGSFGSWKVELWYTPYLNEFSTCIVGMYAKSEECHKNGVVCLDV